MALYTDIPPELEGRMIGHAVRAHDFAISLDVAEPWPGGRIEGRVEAREGRHDRHPITIGVHCRAAWLDVAPQLVGRKPFLSASTYWDLRARAVPVWLDEEILSETVELAPLDEANWRRFSLAVPDGVPRALEGTFVSFRYRIEARRQRAIGRAEASLPLLLLEERTIPCVRVERSPLGTWRLLEWRSEDEEGGEGGGCSVSFEERRPEDMPAPGETREQELRRRAGGQAA
jgi:hypothetical protein